MIFYFIIIGFSFIITDIFLITNLFISVVIMRWMETIQSPVPDNYGQ